MKHNRALFIFRRDLRLQDNTGLNYALKSAKEVILSFIFTPQQIEDNAYRSDRCLQFMVESLEELAQEIAAWGGKLHFFYGSQEQVVQECIEKLQVDLVVVNRDYTPFSIERDVRIKAVCSSKGVSFLSFDDALLQAPERTLKSNGEPYVVFTPYYRNALKLPVLRPMDIAAGKSYTSTISFANQDLCKQICKERKPQVAGGRKAALKIVANLASFADYDAFRDFPALDATTHLSCHLKFTTCSPREVYWAIADKLGAHAPLARSLYWRDFFSCIALHFPYVFKGAFQEQYKNVKWNNDASQFKAWCEGQTGFPIVDAGMRELVSTGFMHNRVRMVVASFLVKDLHIDWRWGEKFFAQNLIDYDPAINNGNWQWAASTGVDAQPYFRIFNPWTQGEKFDPDCVYIKHWVPELSALSTRDVHRQFLEKHRSAFCRYVEPIVDHSVESKLAIESFKAALG